MKPKQPPSLAEFGEQIAEAFNRWQAANARNLNYGTRSRRIASEELAAETLRLVDAYRAQNRGADEPAESAHR
jgi:hypothetical protein